MKIHIVIDKDDEQYRKPFFDSLDSDEIVNEAPKLLFNPRVMTGVQWINKLKSNELTGQEKKYVVEMMQVAKKYDVLAIPAGGWEGLSSQNYKEHRNNTLLHLSKPEMMTPQELTDLTAIYCHSLLKHVIIGECHGLQAYHLYHGGEIATFEAGIILRCKEEPTLVLNNGKFEHQSSEIKIDVNSINESWHQDWSHNTYAIDSANCDYQFQENSHPLQSEELTWYAEFNPLGTCGIHIINGLNHWIKKYSGGFEVTINEQPPFYGIYVIQAAVNYDSDGERGSDRNEYKSKLSKIEEASTWAVMHADADKMAEEYKHIIKSVAFNINSSPEVLENDFKETIFKHIADAYIERLPGRIITRIENNNDYLTQYHPSKSTNTSYGLKEIALRNQRVSPSSSLSLSVSSNFLYVDAKTNSPDKGKVDFSY
ncbi:hypothetical protein L3V82_13065 [Thiotrichales bacterium 19S3-7]|nr:hypothetical protein [Thiotrichales bacterium 19S3-7]MCF6803101.1 hypothetical protein [Thiotrichales bacterium 19S3-11]